MQFKDFEIRPTRSLDDVIDPKRFELVKWYDHEPRGTTNLRTGNVENKTRSCYVVAWLEWNEREPCWELQSVGLRLMEDWVNGLDKWILAWCEMATVCMEDDE